MDFFNIDLLRLPNHENFLKMIENHRNKKNKQE